jgi:hypothetical protein
VIKKALFIVLMFSSVLANAAPLSQSEAIARAMAWMERNPVMSRASQSIAAVETFPNLGNYSVYVVQLDPKGYLVLNSDDRLPLVVSFSPDSSVDLTDSPDNAFRAMLLQYVEQVPKTLSQPVAMAAEVVAATSSTELYGPFLATSWNQCNPYNKLCPANPSGSEYYGYRTASGCVPTAFAQVLNYHRWPLYGSSRHSYTDTVGSITGAHSADFSDPYDWASMQLSYDAFSANPQAAEDAVAELMYELGVAAEADYGTNATSASTQDLGAQLGKHFYFETNAFYNSQAALISPMEADLRAGFPCVVSIPGHAIVADGLLVDGGTKTYHINYGWGGSNNGWWSAGGIPGGSLQSGVASLRPRLMAFPQTNAVSGVAGGSTELRWILPKRREAEAQKLSVKRLEQQAGTWQTNASALTAGINTGWSVNPSGRSGACWYAGPSGPATIVLDEVFVPNASAALTFWTHYKLGTATFTVSASADDGVSYEELFSVNNTTLSAWTKKTISLPATYAGHQVRLRFELSSGSYYSGGGIWIDDLAISSGSWFAWKPFAENLTLGSRRFSATTNGWDECNNFSGFTVYSTSAGKEWAITNMAGVGNCFGITPDGYGGTEYATSLGTITPTSSTRLLLAAKYHLYADPFRILVSLNGISFTEIWSVTGSLDWGNIAVDLSAYAGQDIYVRLEYVVGGYYPDGGGIWIDSIKTQEVTNPELEGQPVHYTTLTNLPAGTNTLAAVLTDVNSVKHELAPPFILTVSAAQDDGDGMPSDWENLYGLDTNSNDGALDPDHDGYSNFQEYIVGTNPTNASRFAISDPHRSGAALSMGWNALSGRRYTVECRDSLTAGSWQVLTNFSGTNGTMSFSATNLNPACFYRIHVQLEE